MIEDVRTLLDECEAWHKDEFALREMGQTAIRDLGDWIEITLPYFDRRNDYLQFYVRREGEEWLLSDHGYVIDDLAMSGCDLNTPERLAILKRALKPFGVERDSTRNALQIRTSPEKFAFSFHQLVQVMLAVDNLVYLGASRVESLYLEDVASRRGEPHDGPGTEGPLVDSQKALARNQADEYEVVVHWSGEDDAFVATAPELPGCSAHGESRTTAIQNLEGAIDHWCHTSQELDDPFSQPKAEHLTPAQVAG